VFFEERSRRTGDKCKYCSVDLPFDFGSTLRSGQWVNGYGSYVFGVYLFTCLPVMVSGVTMKKFGSLGIAVIRPYMGVAGKEAITF